MKEKVRKAISDYLDFDIDELLQGTDALVFGGAVRDAIAGLEIHDVDIVVLPEACEKLKGELEARWQNEAIDIDYEAPLMELYPDILFHPLTFHCLPHGPSEGPIVQLIRPNINAGVREKMFQWQIRLIGQVDLSCCGVAYSASRFGSIVKDAVLDCKAKQFRVLETNRMYLEKNTGKRILKLQSRGWKRV